MKYHINLCLDKNKSLNIKFENVNFSESQLRFFEVHIQDRIGKKLVIIHFFIDTRFIVDSGLNSFEKRVDNFEPSDVQNLTCIWWNDESLSNLTDKEIEEIINRKSFNLPKEEPRQGGVGGVLNAIQPC